MIVEYQWGRPRDGHQKRTSGTTTTLSSTDVPGHDKFILSPSNGNGDWRDPQNDNLWQGVSGINNPCPTGFRLPTLAELEAEVNSWSSKDLQGAFASPLKLTDAGVRLSENGSVVDYLGGLVNYWTSTTFDNTHSNGLVLSDDFITARLRAGGGSVRCIQD